MPLFESHCQECLLLNKDVGKKLSDLDEQDLLCYDRAKEVDQKGEVYSST